MLYCAYGSNINTGQMRQRCPTAEVFDEGIIEGYELEFCKVATLVKKEGTQTPALIWAITKEDEKSLDRYEGYPHKYIKQTVPVQIGGEVFNVMAYIMRDSTHLQSPSPQYLKRIEDGYDEAGFDFTILDDAYDRAITAEYGSEEYDAYQYSFFNDSFWDEVTEINEQNNKLSKAFTIGCSFSKYEDELSFSDSEKVKIIEKVIECHNAMPSSLSLANYADVFFKELRDYTLAGGEVKKYLQQSSKTLYIAYGSNINLAQMKERCPNSKPICVSQLQDYELTFCGCADCQEKTGSSTPVLVWEIDSKDWKRLDSYEGYPSYYDKKIVKVDVNGSVKDAVIYVMTPVHAERKCPPSDMYYQSILQGYKQNNMDTKPLEQARLRAFGAQAKKGKGGCSL